MYGAEQASGYSSSRTWQNLVDLAEFGRLGRIWQTWQNSAEVTDVADIIDIAVETGRQNMAKYSRIQQIAIDCCKLQQSCNWSLIAKLVIYTFFSRFLISFLYVMS